MRVNPREKLVYLDNAQLALLERASGGERTRFAEALESSGALLALSFHHAQETAQLADEESVERRLEVLNGYGRVGFSFRASAEILSLEIEVGLLNLHHGDDGAPDLASVVFPSESPTEFARRVREARPTFIAESRPLLQAAARLERLLHPVRSRPGKRFKNRSADDRSVLDTEPNWLEAREQIRRFHGADPDRAAGKSKRDVVEQDLGIQGFPAVSRVLDEDLALVSVYYGTAKEVAKELTRHAPGEGDSFSRLVRGLDPYSAPGFALWLAHHRARQRSGDDSTASGLVDGPQLSYAPYVDLMFVDKRTHSFLEQEAVRHPELMPTEVLERVRRNSDLRGTMDAIRAIG